MKNNTSQLGILAGLFLGLICIVVAAHSSWTLLQLLDNGKKTDAEVVAISRGVSFRAAKKNTPVR